MILSRGIHFFFIVLLIFVRSNIIAMDSPKQLRKGCLGILSEHIERVKELSGPKKPWLYSDAVFKCGSDSVIASHPNKNIVATGSFGVIRIWDMDIGLKRVIGHLDVAVARARDIAIHPTKDLIAALMLDPDSIGIPGYGSDKLYVQIWNISTGEKVRLFQCKDVKFNKIQFHLQQNLIAVQYDYNSSFVHVWSIETGADLSNYDEKNWPRNRIVHPDVEHKGKDIYIIKEYKDYTLDQLQLKYALSHWLLLKTR